MKYTRMFFLMACFLPMCLAAQTGRWEGIYLKHRPDTTGTIIHLPDIAYYELVSVATAQHPYSFVIKDDSTYQKLVTLRADKNWPRIDFSQFYLMAFAACPQCISLNPPDDDRPRHRNACQYRITWYLKMKKEESIPGGNLKNNLPEPSLRPYFLKRVYIPGSRSVLYLPV